VADADQLDLFGPAPPVEGSGLYAEVVFDRPLDHAYSYRIPAALRDSIAVGKRVLVPFGRGDKMTTGFCVGLGDQEPTRKVKAIAEVLDDEPLLTPSLMRLTRWMADYYLCGWGQVLNAVVPAGAREQAGTRSVTLVEVVPAELVPQPPPRLSPKQQRVIDLAKENGEPIEMHQLARRAQCGMGPVKGLIDKGLLRRRAGRVENLTLESEVSSEMSSAVPHQLTSDQIRVWATIESALRQGGFQTLLLHGVTGSGKTELYLRALEEVLRQGKEAIVLVPEISLTPQTIRAFQGRCRDVAVLHSHLHNRERGAHWRRIIGGKVQVVVGARSAIFAPTRRLGLIVIDEEHENSFKQETTPRYHARDVAVMRAHFENVPILLGSATPSLESWHNAQRGQYTLLTLPKRVLDLPMPQVHLIDMRHDRHPDRRFHALSPSLEKAMDETLETKGQIILLLNRRGFSTYLFCPGCGRVEQCKFCDLALTYHREKEIAMCHYCGYETSPPERCPGCGLAQVKYHGMGTEKLEAEVRGRFPSRRVERMDSDTMRRPGSHKKVLDAFRAGEIDILLGTQMIAKGLDFPNVTLVGVVNADVGLHHADFRAPERTFQLIAQVAGRTGRGPRGGRVLVQTFNPEHPSIALAAAHDYVGFATRELKHRQEHDYPPYQRMARIILRGRDKDATSDFAERLAAAFEPALARLQKTDANAADMRVLGPAEAPVFRLANYYRYHFQLQCSSSAFLHQVLRYVLPSVRAPHGVELAVDVDPQDML
jgi:primosomal protein N' (replication factor Y)